MTACKKLIICSRNIRVSPIYGRVGPPSGSCSLDKLKSGNARTPALSPSLLKMMKEAWTLGSIDYGAAKVRTGFTILALVTDEDLARIVRDVSKELQKIQADSLRKHLEQAPTSARLHELVTADVRRAAQLIDTGLRAFAAPASLAGR